MYWQTNFAMGFGVREYSFYTYMAKPDFQYKNGAMGEMDGAAFINLDGSRTALYDYTKRIIGEMKEFSSVLRNYNYFGSYVVTEPGKTYKDFDWTKFIYEIEECPISVSVDKGVALITKQENGLNELYMLEKIGNVQDELFDKAGPMELTAKLPDGKKKFYFRGKEIEAQPNEKGEYAFSLKVGDAIFVEVLA